MSSKAKSNTPPDYVKRMEKAVLEASQAMSKLRNENKELKSRIDQLENDLAKFKSMKSNSECVYDRNVTVTAKPIAHSNLSESPVQQLEKISIEKLISNHQYFHDQSVAITAKPTAQSKKLEMTESPAQLNEKKTIEKLKITNGTTNSEKSATVIKPVVITSSMSNTIKLSNATSGLRQKQSNVTQSDLSIPKISNSLKHDALLLGAVNANVEDMSVIFNPRVPVSLFADVQMNECDMFISDEAEIDKTVLDQHSPSKQVELLLLQLNVSNISSVVTEILKHPLDLVSKGIHDFVSSFIMDQCTIEDTYQEMIDSIIKDSFVIFTKLIHQKLNCIVKLLCRISLNSPNGSSAVEYLLKRLSKRHIASVIYSCRSVRFHNSTYQYNNKKQMMKLENMLFGVTAYVMDNCKVTASSSCDEVGILNESRNIVHNTAKVDISDSNKATNELFNEFSFSDSSSDDSSNDNNIDDDNDGLDLSTNWMQIDTSEVKSKTIAQSDSTKNHESENLKSESDSCLVHKINRIDIIDAARVCILFETSKNCQLMSIYTNMISSLSHATAADINLFKNNHFPVYGTLLFNLCYVSTNDCKQYPAQMSTAICMMGRTLQNVHTTLPHNPSEYFRNIDSTNLQDKNLVMPLNSYILWRMSDRLRIMLSILHLDMPLVNDTSSEKMNLLMNQLISTSSNAYELSRSCDFVTFSHVCRERGMIESLYMLSASCDNIVVPTDISTHLQNLYKCGNSISDFIKFESNQQSSNTTLTETPNQISWLNIFPMPLNIESLNISSAESFYVTAFSNFYLDYFSQNPSNLSIKIDNLSLFFYQSLLLLKSLICTNYDNDEVGWQIAESTCQEMLLRERLESKLRFHIDSIRSSWTTLTLKSNLHSSVMLVLQQLTQIISECTQQLASFIPLANHDIIAVAIGTVQCNYGVVIACSNYVDSVKNLLRKLKGEIIDSSIDPLIKLLQLSVHEIQILLYLVAIEKLVALLTWNAISVISCFPHVLTSNRHSMNPNMLHLISSVTSFLSSVPLPWGNIANTSSILSIMDNVCLSDQFCNIFASSKIMLQICKQYLYSVTLRIPFFTINLSNRIDRWRTICSQSYHHGLIPIRYEPINGINNFHHDDISTHDVALTWDPSCFIPASMGIDPVGAVSMSPTERSCANSHISIWKFISTLRTKSRKHDSKLSNFNAERILALCSGQGSTRLFHTKNSHERWYLILEDDSIVMGSNLISHIDIRFSLISLIDKTPTDCDILYLDCVFPGRNINSGTNTNINGLVKIDMAWSCSSYILKESCIQILLSNLPIDAPIDCFLTRLIQDQQIAAYATVEPIFKQGGTGHGRYAKAQSLTSDIQHSYKNNLLDYNKSKKRKYSKK